LNALANVGKIIAGKEVVVSENVGQETDVGVFHGSGDAVLDEVVYEGGEDRGLGVVGIVLVE
jgi:hypothetical protein